MDEIKDGRIFIRMDQIDRKILRVLQADARASLQEIGKAVGLSASPCWERIRKLEQLGVIEGYTVRLNARELGYSDDYREGVAAFIAKRPPRFTGR